jgi:hypothetical protein
VQAGLRGRRRGGVPDGGCYNTPRCALGSSRADAARYHVRALSSGGEHFLDAEGVVGSNPTAPTMNATKAPTHSSRGLLLCGARVAGASRWEVSRASRQRDRAMRLRRHHVERDLLDQRRDRLPCPEHAGRGRRPTALERPSHHVHERDEDGV